jgi:hypothetical protein
MLGKLDMKDLESRKWECNNYDLLETRNCVVAEPTKLKSERSHWWHSAKLILNTFEIMKPFN